MIDYSKWERREFSVVGLKLDPLNPRVSLIERGQIDQIRLFLIFVEQYDVLDLAERISRNGYFPDEVIIVYREDEMNRYVLEGNRRVAALKLLINPGSAPEKYKDKFKRLSSETNKALIQKVQAVVAPSREDATPIIIEKHTHTAVKPWSVLMEATYVSDVYRNSKAGESEHQSVDGKLDRFTKMDRMYKLACTLDLPGDVLSKLGNKEKFPMTTVERLYNSPQVRNVLGLSDDFEYVLDRDGFEKMYAQIITDVSRKERSSRTLDKAADREDYARRLRDMVPVSHKSRKARITELIREAKEPRCENIPVDKQRSMRSVRKSKGIIPSHFAFKLTQGASVRKICDELKQLPVDTFPNVSAAAFRIFLEKSIKLFLKTNKLKTIPYKPPRLETKDQIEVGEATLGPLLEYLGKRDISYINETNVKKIVNNFRNSNDSSSLGMLNSIMHNEEINFEPEKARNLWPSLERLFIIMLSETEKKDG